MLWAGPHGVRAARRRRSARDVAGGFLQVRARRDLDGVGRRDVDGLAGLRVAAGPRGALGALDGDQTGDGDLLAAGDGVDELVLQARQDRVHGRGRDIGTLGDRGDQFALVHRVPLGVVVGAPAGTRPGCLSGVTTTRPSRRAWTCEKARAPGHAAMPDRDLASADPGRAPFVTAAPGPAGGVREAVIAWWC